MQCSRKIILKSKLIFILHTSPLRSLEFCHLPSAYSLLIHLHPKLMYRFFKFYIYFIFLAHFKDLNFDYLKCKEKTHTELRLKDNYIKSVSKQLLNYHPHLVWHQNQTTNETQDAVLRNYYTSFCSHFLSFQAI